MVKIKICGLWRPEDIQAVNAAKPDYIGFVFAASSRRVTAEQAASLRQLLLPDIISVGVFVNEEPENILSLTESGVIGAIQLHGNESRQYIEELKAVTNKPVIKAIAPRRPGDVQEWQDIPADYLLFDHPGGGTGRVFNWDLIREVERPYFLAGGLNIENIGDALQKTAPFGVDISSGVETDGFKDAEKIKSIIRRIRDGQ